MIDSLREDKTSLQQTNESLQEELQRLKEIEKCSIVLLDNFKQVKDAYDSLETELTSKRQSLEQMVCVCNRLESQIHDPHSAKVIERTFWNIMNGQKMHLSPAQLARRTDLRKKIHNSAGILVHGLTDETLQRLSQEFGLLRYSKANAYTLISLFNVMRVTLHQIFKTDVGVLDDRDMLDLTTALDSVWLYLRVWWEFLQKMHNDQSSNVNVISRNHHGAATGLPTVVTRYFELYAYVKQWHEDTPPEKVL